MAEKMSPLITPVQLAEILQVSIRTIYYLARRGTLPSIKIGKHLRFRVESVLANCDTANHVTHFACHPSNISVKNNQQFRSLKTRRGCHRSEGGYDGNY